MYAFNNINDKYFDKLLPNNRSLIDEIDEAIKRLSEKFTGLDSSDLKISDYNLRYFRGYLSNPGKTFDIYKFNLCWALSDIDKPLRDITFIDHGGGCGIQSLLARELGIGRIIYNDIYDVSGIDAERIAEKLGLRADDYHIGEMEDLVVFIQSEGISPDVFASRDVIEHIYDIEGFLGRLGKLSESPISVIMASGANEKNFLRAWKIARQQRVAEYKSRDKKWGHKDRDTLRPYIEIRREIIVEHFPKLEESEVGILAERTRGMAMGDIITTIEKYLSSSELPSRPSHKTNTCDPYTGNWLEHLMDSKQLREILKNNGFEATVLPVPYSIRTNDRLKRTIGGFINRLMAFLPGLSMKLASSFAIYARK